MYTVDWLTCGDLLGAESERRTHTGDDDDDGEDVYDVAGPAVDAVAEDWVDGGAHGHWLALAVRGETEGESDEAVRHPAVEAPVEYRQRERPVKKEKKKEGRYVSFQNRRDNRAAG